MILQLLEPYPGIFVARFDNKYDLAMTFLRYSEFYESQQKGVVGSAFQITDYMRWYAVERSHGVFTYPEDWVGFNIPSEELDKIIGKELIPDRNAYDDIMLGIYRIIRLRRKERFCLIGIDKPSDTLAHEFAHGFYYFCPEYRKEMQALVKNLDDKTATAFTKLLIEMGYGEKVIADETQAYMATGLTDHMRITMKRVKTYRSRATLAPFKKLFKEKFQEVQFPVDWKI
jgi:hypothetical protein